MYQSRCYGMLVLWLYQPRCYEQPVKFTGSDIMTWYGEGFHVYFICGVVEVLLTQVVVLRYC